MKAHFAMFARYNEWCNRRIYDVAGRLPDSDYRAERGAFFGSVHRTLNHILVGDRIWMRRFTGEGPTYTNLDATPCEDFATLNGARQAEDARIGAYIDALDAEKLAGTISYRTVSKPTDIVQPLAPALAHFFNHQTHHRGQVHCLLTQTAGRRETTPSMDLIVFQRETGIGLS